VRAAGFSEGDACALTGSYIPFAETKSHRQQNNDRRLFLQERYGTLAAYTRMATAAVEALVRQRLLLSSDKAAAIAGHATFSESLH
jgi:hypothetical protein